MLTEIVDSGVVQAGLGCARPPPNQSPSPLPNQLSPARTARTREGASTVLTKTVDSRVSRLDLVLALGSAMAPSRVGTRADTSGLRITEPTWRKGL